MAHEDLHQVCITDDMLIWECPECGKLNRDRYKEDRNALYSCKCGGVIECDIGEYIIDIEWSD